jgi:hypothetical protein
MKVKTNLRAGSGANAGGVNAGGASAGGGSANSGGVNGHNSSENNTVVTYIPPVVASRCVGL